MPERKQHPIPLILSLLVLLLVVPLLAYSVILLEGPRIRQEALANLNAIGRLKTDQIETWLAERHDDATALMTRDRFIDDVEKWLDHRDPVAEARIAIRQKSLRYAFYSMEFLAPDSQEPKRRPLLAAALASGRPQMSELYRDSTGQVWLDLVAPLIKPADGKKVGAVVLRIQASSYLFPLLQTWPTASHSAETLLVRRDGDSVLFLNELRHRKGTALNLRLPLATTDMPSAMAIRSGAVAQTIEGHDYRGIPVLAAVSSVRGTQWAMVSKIDRDEVMQPLNTLVTWVSVIALCADIAIALTVLLLWRLQQRSHRLELLSRTGERDRLLSMFFNLPFMGMAIIDADDGHWLHANDRLCEILGYPHEELLANTTWRQLTHPDDLATCLTEYGRIKSGEIDGYQLATQLLHKNGGYIDIALAAKCVRRPDGSPEYIVTTMRDITERKRLEEANAGKQRATGMLTAIAAASTDVIFAKDTAGNYLFCNAEMGRGLDMHPQDIVGKNDTALFSPEQADKIIAMDRAIVASGGTRTFEETIANADGVRTFLTTKGVLLDGEGRSLGMYGIARDITERKQQEIELGDSRTRLAGIILSAMDAIVTMDNEQCIRLFNPAAERMFGYTAAEMIGRSIDALIPAPLRAKHKAHIQRFAAEGVTSRNMRSLGELRALRRDGSEFPIEASISVVEAAGEQLFTAILRDISERKQAEAALSESEQRFQTMANSAPVLIWMAGVGEKCSWFNQQWLDFTGRELAQELDNGWAVSVHPEDQERCLAAYHEYFERREPFEMEYRLRRADGQYRWIIDRGVPRFSPSGEFLGFIGSCVDVTARKLAEDARRVNEERLRMALTAANAGIWDWDIGGRQVIWSPENYALYGLDPDAGMPIQAEWERCIHPDDLAGVKQALEDVRLGRTPEYRTEFRVLHPEFGERWLSGTGRIQHSQDGIPLRMTGINLNITERKRIEQALRENGEDLDRAQAVAHIGSWRLNVIRNELTWSAENHRIFGIPEGTPMTYETFLACVHPDDRGEVDRAWQAALHGEPYDIKHRLLVDGQVKWAREKAELEFDADGNLLGGFGTTQDISELKAAEQALEAARAAAIEEKTLLETVMQTLPVGVAIVDKQGGNIRHNTDYEHIWRGPRPPVQNVDDYVAYQAWWADSGQAVQPHEWASALAIETGELVANQMLRIQRFDGSFGYVLNSAAPLRNSNFDIIGSAVVVQDISELKRTEQALRDSEERFQLAAEIGRSGTWDWNVKTGEVIWSRGHYEVMGYREGEVKPSFQAWVNRIHVDDRAKVDAEIHRSMLEHQEYVAEFRLIWPDNSVHWMSARARHEYDANGDWSRMLGVMADITSLKQAELALRAADQRKDEFLAMLSHELRNPLTPIRNAAHVLGRLDVNEPRVRWAQEIIERQVTHLTHLVDELLDVSRIARGKVKLKMTQIVLADLIRQACETVQPLMAAKKHRFDVHLPATTVLLEGDLVRLIQVLQNLLNNAAKYTPDGGHIELSGRLLEEEIELQVRDNGMGMPAELLPGVFDLFIQGERTLDRSQGGLGIGLTLVRRLVDLHGGRVDAYSPGAGLGATFTVRLPLAQIAADIAAPTDSKPAGTQASRRQVLVVDDDPVVAESMVVFLELEGHQVRSADSGDAALRVLTEFWPQVVLLDIGLPDMDGYAVAQAIRQLPGGDALKLVAVSGYGHEEAMARSRQAGFDRHLVKPVDPEKISALLMEIDTVNA